MARQTHIDSLRGIAALIVIIVHYLAAFYPYTIFGAQEGYQQHLAVENIVFFPPFGMIVGGQFAVCLFFILSGYVLSYSALGQPIQARKMIAAIIKRPIRLGGLVLFSILAASLLWSLNLYDNTAAAELSSSTPWFSHFWSGNFDFSALLLNLSTAPFSSGEMYNVPLWTVKIELYGSIMVYAFLLFFSQNKYRLGIALFLIYLEHSSLYQGFWIGVAIADIVKHHKAIIAYLSQTKPYYFMVALFLFFSSYPNYVSYDFIGKTVYGFLPDDGSYGGGYPMLSAVLIFLLLVAGTALKKRLDHPLLHKFGDISYGLYTTHFLILGSFSAWLFQVSQTYVTYHTAFVITFLVGVSISLVVAHLATKYIDVPSIKLASYIGRKVVKTIPEPSFAYVKQFARRRSA